MAAATLLGVVSGCKKKDNTPDAQATPDNRAVKLEHAYTEHELGIDVGQSANNLVYSDGRLYFIRYASSDNRAADEVYESSTQIVSALLDGTDEKVHGEWKSVYDPFSDNRVRSESYPTAYGVAADGSIVVAERVYTSDETNPNDPIYEEGLYIVKLSAEGEELLRVPLDDEVSAMDMYIERVLFDAAGNVYLVGWNSIVVLDGATLKYAFMYQENNGMNGSFATPEGEIMIITYGMAGMEFKTLDFAAKSAKPGKTYEGNKYFYNTSDGFGRFAFCFPYEANIYGFDLETMTDEMIVSGANSDIDLRQIGSMVTLADGFIVSKYLDEGGTTLVRLIENPDAMVGDKTIVTLGVLYGGQVESQVMAFNRQSTTTRIMVTDYSQYNTQDDYTAGMLRLDADIMAGRAPDIICFDDGGLQASKYAAKGALADLYPLLDADTTVKREDLFENILKAGEVDGKLVHMIAGFGIFTLAGKESIFGDVNSITPQELARIADSRPGSLIMEDMTVDNWLQFSVLFGLEQYVDWATGKCDFDNPDFIAALEFAKRFPKEIDYGNGDDWEVRQRESAEAILSGKTLLQMASFYDGIRSVRSLYSQLGENPAFVGFPAPEGQSGHIISARMDFGISATSPHKELAWEFISRFLAEDYSSGDRWSNTISANRLRFEREAAEELKPLSERDLSKGLNIMIQVGNSGWGTSIYSEEEYIDFLERSVAYSGVDIEALRQYEMTEDEVARARQVIEGATVSLAQNEQIFKIIQEEAESFLSGAKTAQEAARIIQSRVALYVAESI